MIRINVGDNLKIVFSVDEKENCIAFRDSVVKSCNDLLLRLELKRREGENEQN